jgi:hypothetical protein
MFQVFKIAIVAILIFAGLIIGLDDFLDCFNWLPKPIRDLNAIDIAAVPIALSLYALFQHRTNKDRKNEQLNKGIQMGSAQCQRLNVSVVGQKLILKWVDTARVSTDEMSLWCGSEEAAENFNDDCEHALTIKTEITPCLSTKLAFSAVFSFIARHTANLQAFMGKSRTHIVVAAIEDQAQILTTRFFEIPPALLLLFWDDKVLQQMHTVRSVQSYRFVALKILARQILDNAGEAPSWSDFSATPVYAVRDLPTRIEEGEIDWWSRSWDFDPRKKLSVEEIVSKRDKLIVEIESKSRYTANDPTIECFPVVKGLHFETQLNEVNINLAAIPAAKWF